jgi:hypothetical protein
MIGFWGEALATRSLLHPTPMSVTGTAGFVCRPTGESAEAGRSYRADRLPRFVINQY